MQSGGEGAGKGKLEALTVFSQKIQAREKGGNKQGEKEGAEHKDETKEQKREERANQQEGGVERGAGSPGTSLARKTRSQRERLRNKGQYRGVRSQRTNVQGAIYSMDDTSL